MQLASTMSYLKQHAPGGRGQSQKGAASGGTMKDYIRSQGGPSIASAPDKGY